jgi:hypothetical protein
LLLFGNNPRKARLVRERCRLWPHSLHWELLRGLRCPQ